MDLRRHGTTVFSGLFLLLISYQTILVTVVPLEAHEILGNAQRVSEIYLAVGITTMLGRQSIPWLVTMLGRRLTFTAGCGAMMVAAAFLAQRSFASLVQGNEIITEMTNWPTIEIQVGSQTIKRPAILERKSP